MQVLTATESRTKNISSSNHPPTAGSTTTSLPTSTTTSQLATDSVPPITAAPTIEPASTISPTEKGPVFIFPRLVFHTNNTVPSESEVLSQASPFLNGDEILLNDTVRVQNLTYERLTHNSFALTLGYKINDMSFPENVDHQSETEDRIQESVNVLMNRLLNQPTANPFTFPQANYIHTPNEIQANVEYNYQAADISQPSGFLNAILTASGASTTTAPSTNPTTPVVPATQTPTVTGPVFIFPRLVFHTNNTVPSESEVLSRATPFLNGDEILLNDTVRVQNLTYERLTNTSFALTLGYKINDVSFPENVDLRSEIEDRIQDSVNVLMNGLLNQPTANPFTFSQANYIHTPDEIQANVEYTYQAADISQPSGFLNAILTASGAPTTTAPSTNPPTPVVPATQTPTVTGLVFIFPRLVFHTNNTVPSESEVLSRATPFLNGDEILLNDTVRLQNLTFERLTNTSFALTLGYKINDVSFPENVDLRSETEDRIQDSVNVLMNGLLNQPTTNPFTFSQANYIHTPDEIQANVEYTYQAADISQPSGFLNAILTASGASTTTAPPTNPPTPVVPATQTPTVTGPVFIFPRLVFHTNNTVPSESEVLSRATPFLNGDEILLNDTVRVQNLTYERLTNNSFALTLGYMINDVSFPENVDLRSETEDRIQDSVNVLMNGLLNQPTANTFTFPQANYIHMPDEIQANVEYTYQAADISQPSGFLNAILTASGASTTTAPSTNPTTPVVPATQTPTVTGLVFIFPRLVFHTNNTVSSESEVLSRATPFLNGDEILLNDTVRLQNLTYERLTNTSFALTLGYKINDVSFPENVDLRSETEDRIQDSVNVLMNGLLNQPTANPFTFSQANYIHTPDEIQANVEYTYQAADISQPSGFLNAILTASGASTTTAPPTNPPTPVVPATQTPTVTGPVFIFPRLVFHTNNTVPSESEVLSRATPFLNGDEILLNDTVRVQNLTYERLTNNSFALTLGYMINDVSFPENVDLRSETEDRIQDSVNVLMNGLLNQPTANTFTFPQANYIHMPDEIQANVEYTYQAADISQPSGFLNAILTASGAPTTTAPSTNPPTPVVPATQTPTVTGLVFIFPRLVFHTNNTVPSESEVLSRATPFLNGDEILFNDTVRLQNLTYERLTNTSFALTLGYKINDVSFPENVDLRSETEDRIQDSVNVLMNGLLNQPTANPFTFSQANYIHTPDEIQANVEYTYQAADISQPSGFLNAILTASGASTTTAPPTNPPNPVVPATQTPTVTGPVFIFPRLVFHTNNTVPSESEVLSRATPFLNGDEILLNDTVRVQNLTYERLTNNSFALTLGYTINDVSFPENVDLRSETEDRIQDSVNVLMNGLLNQPTANTFTFPQANYIHMPDEIQANVEYTYQAADISQPSGFLNAILTASGASTTTAPPTNPPTPVVPATQTPTVTGPVFIFPRLVFHTNNTVPSESEVISRATPFLNGDEILLSDTVRVQNLTYERMTNNSFALTLGYKINDVSFPENVDLRSETEDHIQDSVNVLMNGLLNQPTANPFTYPQANYIHMTDEIQANVEYTYQAADISQPSGFLNAILTASGASTATAPPTNPPTPVVPATQTPTVTGPVFIFPRLVFHTNNTVPSESEVLSRATPFLNGYEILLNDTVRVQNLTYERLTNNSFALTLGYTINDVSFPENVDLRSETEDRIQDSVNVLMNGLLNQPTANTFTFPQANYIHTPDEIQANVEYTYQAADISQPSGFLNAILTASGASTATAPPTNPPTPVVPATQTPTVTGPVFIFPRLVFHTNNTVPSESEVISRATPFLNGDEILLNDTVRVQNLTYERLTNTSFALTLGYKINDVSFPENIDSRSETEDRIQDSVNVLMNGLLNQPTANPFTFSQANYIHSPDEIQANVEYTYQAADISQPSGFLNAILTASGASTATAPPTNPPTPVVPATQTPTVTGPVFIFPRLVFHTNNTVPSESEVLSRATPFLNGYEILLNDTVRVQNLTYERLTNNSFALTLGYTINDVSFPENVDLRSETEDRIQDSVNVLMNGLLNQPTANTFTFPQANYIHTPDEIQANVEYTYQAADISQPSGFLNAILTASGASTATAPPTNPPTPVVPATQTPTVTGPVFIFPRLVFHTNNTVPSESEVISRATPFLNGDEILLNDTVRVQNLTYERLTNTSFALTLGYKINDVSFPENIDSRSETEDRIQDSVNVLMNGLLNQPTANPFTFSQANYIHSPDEIQANVEYTYQAADISQPSGFLNAILTASGASTTTAPSKNPPTPVVPTTQTPTVLGTVFIIVRFVFTTIQPAPSENEVLSKADLFLNRQPRELKTPISVSNLTYERLTDYSFALRLRYKINNVTFATNAALRADTEQLIQNETNTLLNELLNQPDANPFTFPEGAHNHTNNEIHTEVNYHFKEGDITQPSSFLNAILEVSGLLTTAAPTTTSTTNSTNPAVLLITKGSGSVAWILGFIIPVGIVIILLPFWILLCCLLFGGFAAIKKRWRRRQAYHLQQYMVHPLAPRL